nr:endo alpha-1,4 polygalactosaminidase [Metabacillus mangrovi]
MKQLSKYQMVIIEPVFYSAEQISLIQENGTLVYGYVNSMEADLWNKDLYSRFDDGDFYKRNGERIYIEEWNSYLMDMKSSHFREVLLDETEKQIVQKGLDGVFLDTVGNIDDRFSEDRDERTAQQDGLILLLKQLQKKEVSIIQNWGLETVQRTAPYIDGLMWENFEYKEISSDDWSKEWMEKTRHLSRKYRFSVLTVSDRNHKESSRLAREKGFIHFPAPEGYNYNQF